MAAKRTTKKAPATKKAAAPKSTARPISRPTPAALPDEGADDTLTQIDNRNGLPCFQREGGGYVFQSIALVVRESERGENYDHVARWAYATGTSPYMMASEAEYDTRAAALAALKNAIG